LFVAVACLVSRALVAVSLLSMRSVPRLVSRSVGSLSLRRFATAAKDMRPDDAKKDPKVVHSAQNDPVDPWDRHDETKGATSEGTAKVDPWDKKSAVEQPKGAASAGAAKDAKPSSDKSTADRSKDAAGEGTAKDNQQPNPWEKGPAAQPKGAASQGAAKQSDKSTAQKDPVDPWERQAAADQTKDAAKDAKQSDKKSTVEQSKGAAGEGTAKDNQKPNPWEKSAADQPKGAASEAAKNPNPWPKGAASQGGAKDARKQEEKEEKMWDPKKDTWTSKKTDAQSLADSQDLPPTAAKKMDDSSKRTTLGKQ